MTELDLEAIRARWEKAKIETIDNRATANPGEPVGVSMRSLSTVWDSTTDIPDLLELVKAVKLGWQQEKERADRLQADLDAAHEFIDYYRAQAIERGKLMDKLQKVVDSAKTYAAAWDALRPSNPDVQAWHDARGPLLVAIRDLDKGEK